MSPQHSIAHYRITAKLGEGGMGEVWRATDTKLSREVAIYALGGGIEVERFPEHDLRIPVTNDSNLAAMSRATVRNCSTFAGSPIS